MFDGRSWRELIEEEELIDLTEWADVRGEPAPLPWPAAMTRALWDATVAAAPVQRRPPVPVNERVRGVVRAADRALRRRLAMSPNGARHPFILSFAAPLSARSGGPDWRPLRLAGQLDRDGQMRLLIGLAHELKGTPPAR